MRVVCLSVVFAMGLSGLLGGAQDEGATRKTEAPKNEPKYDETFSGPIIEVSSTKITVSRSILGKPAEKHTFWIKPDTRIEGKLKVKVRVTVGFVTTDDGDVARLIVVRSGRAADVSK